MSTSLAGPASCSLRKHWCVYRTKRYDRPGKGAASTAPANDRRFPAEKEDAIVKWALDPSHSTTNFAIRHMMSKVRGTISVKEGWIEADEAEDPSSASVEVVLDAASVHTGVAPRDADL